jgi:hypothetical protein
MCDKGRSTGPRREKGRQNMSRNLDSPGTPMVENVRAPERASRRGGTHRRRPGRLALATALVAAAVMVVASLAGCSQKKEEEPFDPANYEDVEYATVARSPEDYKDRPLHFEGKVIQVIEKSDSECDLRVATSVDGYQDVYYVSYDPKIIQGNHVVEGQYLGVYGRCTGQVSYQSALGGQVSIPGIKADSIDESVKSPQQTQVEAMEALFSDVTWEKVDVSGYGNYEYEATVTNTTDNDYGMVSLILGVYDAGGTRIGEAYANTNSWGAGEAVKFDAYLDPSIVDAADSVKVEVQGFNIGSDYYSPNAQ